MSKAALSIKTFLPRTLLGRSLLILILPIFLIQLVTTYIFFDRHWNRMTMRLAYGVAGEISMLADLIEQDHGSGNLRRVASFAKENLDFDVEFKSGEKLTQADKARSALSWETMITKSLSGELAGFLGERPFTLDVDFHEKWIWVGVQIKGGVVHVTLPQRRLFSSSGYIFLLWMIGTSIILLSIAVLFMRNQIRPIRKLAVAAERFGKGRDVQSFRPAGALEVRQAAQAFLDMRERIRRQIEQRTTMLAGVSHDLRTPLTRLKLQLAMLGDSPDVDAMKNDIADMERMIGGYLDFVRGEGDEPVSFTSLNQLVDKVVTAGRRQGVEVSSAIEGDINIMLRPMAFERCLLNLVSNAGKYAQNVWITVSTTPEKDVEIAIEDDGPGIPEDQYEEVFRPFYRVDTSRNTETGGVGLGLPIAMDIVHAHGGRIWLQKSRHGGLCVMISVPL